MFILRKTKKVGAKTYHSVVLAESVWDEKAKRSRHKTHLNLSTWPEADVVALEKLLKGQKGFRLDDVETTSGKSLGGIYCIKALADELGISRALGTTKHAKLAQLLIAGRILTQGSRLKLCEWGETQEIASILGIDHYDENDLYNTLDWLSMNQAKIEQKLFESRYGNESTALYLYDITSSYLEGEHNALAAFGYNRDGKKGKKQVVIGLLTDKEGIPITVEVFKGNTTDCSTVESQVDKMSERFGIEKLVLVGDRGMIKSTQIKRFSEGISYITAITKAQIDTLIKRDVIQLGLFDNELIEVEDDGVRYILRRNPDRAIDIQRHRADKLQVLQGKVAASNRYLRAHPKAHVSTQLNQLTQVIAKLKLKAICRLEDTADGTIRLLIDEQQALECARLDGCYVIKTDLKKEDLSTQEVHQRYKDLTHVEHAFRTMKTTCLEVRPIFVRKESRTRGHVFVTMLSYMVVQQCWKRIRSLGITLDHAWQTLNHLQTTRLSLNDTLVNRVPTPSDRCQQILQALGVSFPKSLPLVGN